MLEIAQEYITLLPEAKAQIHKLHQTNATLETQLSEDQLPLVGVERLRRRDRDHACVAVVKHSACAPPHSLSAAAWVPSPTDALCVRTHGTPACARLQRQGPLAC
eukprot:931586-Prymnesium_polylepis.3